MAVLLAGGRGSRLGGRHKPDITVAGRTMLDRALAAVAGADRTVIVGPVRPIERTGRDVRWTVEQPPGGGPVAALAAGLTALAEPGPDTEPDGFAEVAVLATDLAGVTAGTIDRLRGALAARPDTDGTVLCDATGHRQWLLGVWRPAPLRAALPARPAGLSLRSVLATLSVTEVPELPGESADIDTPADLARARAAAAGEGPVTGGPSQPSHW